MDIGRLNPRRARIILYVQNRVAMRGANRRAFARIQTYDVMKQTKRGGLIRVATMVSGGARYSLAMKANTAMKMHVFPFVSKA